MNAWRGKGITKNGKEPMVFKQSLAKNPDDRLELPCGQCIGCRLERSRQWAMRISNEAALYENNCFVTLTFDNENLPENLSVDKTHLQKFMKRLRKKYPDQKIRFFGCGEYGDKYNRPHYHLILFNYDPEDKELCEITKLGHRLYKSETLASLWPFGMNVVGDVTFESAAYVARYVMKKRTGKNIAASGHYRRVDDSTGEVFNVEPEFVLMSRRPGIGKDWFDLYYKDCYPKDSITIRGQKMKPPKFYDKKFEELNEKTMEKIKTNRVEYIEKFVEENLQIRLIAREKIQQRKLDKLVRTQQ